MALCLRTKPHTNGWLYLSPRLDKVSTRAIAEKRETRVAVNAGFEHFLHDEK